MKNYLSNLLMRALEIELKAEGEAIRPYLIDTLVENILKLAESENKAPQVEAEEQGTCDCDYLKAVKESILNDIREGALNISPNTKIIPL